MKHHDQSSDRASHLTSVSSVFIRSGSFSGMASLAASCIQDTLSSSARLAWLSACASKGILHISMLRASSNWISRESPYRCVSFRCLSYVCRLSCERLLTVKLAFSD